MANNSNKKTMNIQHFHHHLGIKDNELKNLSIVINEENYNNYIDNTIQKDVNVHIVADLEYSSIKTPSTIYIDDNENRFYSLGMFQISQENTISLNRVNNTTIINKNDMVDSIRKYIKTLDFVLSYQHLYNVDLFNVKNLYIYFSSEICELIPGKYLSVNHESLKTRENSYNYHAISALYDKIINFLSNENNENHETMKEQYAHITIAFYGLRIYHGFSLNYINNKYAYLNKEPHDILSRIIEIIVTKNNNNKSLSVEDFCKKLLFEATVVSDVSSKISNPRHVRDIIFYKNKGGVKPENINASLEKAFDVLSIYYDCVKNHNKIADNGHGQHSYTLYDLMRIIDHDTSDEKINNILLELWTIYYSIFRSFYEIPDNEKEYNNTISRNNILFLFNKNVDSFFSNAGKTNKDNSIMRDLSEMGIKDVLPIENMNDCMDDCLNSLSTIFFIPFMIKKANDHFELNISENTIKQFYNDFFYYVCSRLKIKGEQKAMYELENESRAIIYHLASNIDNKNKLINFITIFPYMSEIMLENYNSSDLHYPYFNALDMEIIRNTGVMVNFILESNNDFYDLVINNNINFKHYVNVFMGLS